MAHQFHDPRNLPKMLDYQGATMDSPLSRETKMKMQITLSKMTRDQIKDTIKSLKQMEYECLQGKARITWENYGKYVKDAKTQMAFFKEIPEELKDQFKMASWCKFCRDYAEKYLYSLDYRKKV